MHQSRRSLLIAPFATSLAFAASGCGATGPLPDSTDRDDSVGTVTEAFNTPDVCGMINTIGPSLSALGGAAVSIVPHCNPVTFANTYFNGAALADHTLNDVMTLPAVTTGAYYCAIADSTGATVDGTAHSVLGRFGLSSQFDVTTRDPSHNTLTAYRTGTLWLFGAPAKLESQTITITDKGEASSDGRFWGGYFGVSTVSTNWDISGSVTFPVGPATVTVSPSLQVISPTASDTNDSVALSGTMPGNARASTYSYSAWLPCVAAQTCPRSVVGVGEFQLDHAFACPASMTSTTDGVLPYYNPYGGAGCSSQNFIYIDGLHNWFEFGRPVAVHSTSPSPNVPPSRPDEEKNHTLQSGSDSANATFLASLGVNVALSVDIVDITLDTTVHLASRDGFGVYQQHTQPVDAKQGTINLWTQLNAQTRADATITGTIALSGLLPPFSFSFGIPIADPGDKEAVNPVSTNFNNDQYPAPVHMQYFDEGTQGLHSYSVNTVYKADADGSRLACMFDTTTTSSQPPLAENAGGFLKTVATNAVNAIHPCHVRTCQPDGTHEIDYEWNSSQDKLVQSSSTTGNCTFCNQVRMSICDAAGNVLQGTTPINHGTLSHAPPICVR